MMQEQAVTTVAKTATYGGSGVAIIFGLNASEFAAVGGLIIAALGLLVQWYYRNDENNMRRELHEAQMSEWDGRERRKSRALNWSKENDDCN